MCQHLIPQIQHSKILIGIHKPVYVDAKVSPATISELNKKAYVPIEDWRNRPLQGGKYPYVYVEASTCGATGAESMKMWRFCGYCGKILPAALRQPESMADRASSALP